MKVDLPETLRAQAGLNDDSGLIYPGSQFSGIHVEGGRGNGDGEVELRFTSPDAPEAVARWYADPARAADFSLGQNRREGPASILAGTTKEDQAQFQVRLSPGQSGGTDGQVVISDRNR